MDVQNVKDIGEKQVESGVRERTLVPAGQTYSKSTILKHWVIEEGSRFEVDSDWEALYYMISGRAVLTYHRHESDFKYQFFDGDTCTFVPAGTAHKVTNIGEGDLRLLGLLGKCDNPKKGRLVRQIFPATAAESYCTGTNYYINLPILGETMKEMGAQNIYLLEFWRYFGSDWGPKWTTGEGRELMWYYTRGQGEFLMNDKKYQIRPGSFAYAPPRTMVSERNATDDVLTGLMLGVKVGELD